MTDHGIKYNVYYYKEPAYCKGKTYILKGVSHDEAVEKVNQDAYTFNLEESRAGFKKTGMQTLTCGKWYDVYKNSYGLWYRQCGRWNLTYEEYCN